MIFSLYAPEYHNYLQFYVMFLTLLGVQVMAAAAGAMFGARQVAQ